MEKDLMPIKLEWSLLEKDKLYDEKSLFWENNILSEIQDEDDTDKRTEGRLGEFKIQRIQTKMGIAFFFPIVKLNKSLLDVQNITDEADRYTMENDTRLLCLEKLDAAQAETVVGEYEASSGLRKYTEEVDETDYVVFEGVIPGTGGELFLGTRLLVSDKSDDLYVFTYAGKGNYTDIKMERNIIAKRLIRTIKRR